MRKRIGIWLSLMVVVALTAAAQNYQPPTRANEKDVYCSGFWSASPVPASLRVVMGEDAVGRVTYSLNDYVYLGQGSNGGVSVGQRYSVVRPVHDPDPNQAFHKQNNYGRWGWKNEYIGQLYEDVGRLEVVVVHPTTATALVTHACDALRRGDVVIPFQERPAPEYKAAEKFDRFAPPSGKAQARVVQGKDFAYTAGQGSVVYVALGSNHGAKVGDYVRFFRSAVRTDYKGYKDMDRGQLRKPRGTVSGYGTTKMRPDLPREVLGEGLLVHVDQKGSTVIVTHSLREVHLGDFAELE